jgi:hypothetical protein
MNPGVTDGRIMIRAAVRPCPKIRLAIPYPSGIKSEAMSTLRARITATRTGRLEFLKARYGKTIIE